MKNRQLGTINIKYCVLIEFTKENKVLDIFEAHRLR